jgi:hypothetical protein
MVGQKGLTIFDIGDPTLKLDWQFATDRAFAVRRGPTPTFTRSTTATYEDSTGVIRTAAINEPRIDFDPTTLACSGLLLEEARTNLTLRSDDFANAAWFKSELTASANSTTSPDGTANADLLAETTVNGGHNIYPNTLAVVTAGSAYTASVFLKKGPGATAPDFVVLTFITAAFGNVRALFNVSTGAIGQTVGSPIVSAKQYPSGWWRVSITATATASVGGAGMILYFNNNNPTTSISNYAGQTTSNLYIWGAQFELGAFPTSYIPTTTASVPRGVDVLEITGANFSNFWNQPEGTLVLEVQKAYSATSAISQLNYLSANDGTGLNYLQFAQRGQGVSGEVFRVELGGTSQVLMAAGAAAGSPGPINATNTPFRLGGAYKANDFAAAINGSDCGIDTTGSVPTLTQLQFVTVSSANHIRSLQYYGVRKTNAELTRLTQLSTLDPALTLDLQFALDATYFSRRGPMPTFTRASSARFVGPTGLIQAASSNVPRIDYDPITLQPRGLLIEELRQNLTIWSEDTTQVTWAKTAVTATANTTTAPDGSGSADTISETTANSQHFFYSPAASITSGTAYSNSIFLKKGSGATAPDWVVIAFLSAGFGSKAIAFNVSTGVFGVAGGGLTGTSQAYPNGWWRINVVSTATASGTHGSIYIGFTNNANTISTPIYTGQTTSDVFIWGAQFEAGAFATSYIPTTTGPLTRSADVCSITGAAFTGFYNQTEGTMAIKLVKMATYATNPSYLTIDDNSSNNRFSFLHNNSGPNEQFSLTTLGATQASFTTTTLSPLTVGGYAGRYKLNDVAWCASGGAVATDVTANMPTVIQMNIGNRQLVGTMSGWIQAIQYYNTIKTNAQLQALSTP